MPVVTSLFEDLLLEPFREPRDLILVSGGDQTDIVDEIATERTTDS